MGYGGIGKGLELFFYLFFGGACLTACCVGCCCKIAYDRFVAHQHQEVKQSALIDLLSGITNNNPDFSREIELSSNQPDIEEFTSLLGN